MSAKNDNDRKELGYTAFLEAKPGENRERNLQNAFWMREGG